MKITHNSDDSYTMTAESESDQVFLDALHKNSNNFRVNKYFFQKERDSDFSAISGVSVDLSCTSHQALSDHAAREIFCALRKVVGLSLSYTANDGHVGPKSAHPQP